jgi:adhesin/invasin
VLVKDQFNAALPDVTVGWSISGDGSISASSVTNGSGIASATPTLGTLAGSVTVTATVNGAIGSPVTFTHTATAGAAAALELISGAGQTGNTSAQLAEDFVVRVHDDIGSGNGVSGVTVDFTVTAGGGSRTPTSDTTDADGLAATRLTLGSGAGANTLEASSAGLTGSPVVFSADATAGTPTQIVVQSGGSQSGVIAGAAAALITFRVKDVGDAGVPDVTVSFSVSSGGGSRTPATDVSDSNGDVSVTHTTGTTVGGNEIRATALGGTISAATTTTTVAGTQTQLGITTQPESDVATGVVWNQQPAIQLQDQYGNAKATSGITITAAINTGTDTLGGTLTANTDSNGLATFTDLSITGNGTNTLIFTSPSLTSVVSGNVQVTGQVADHLGFVQQPSTVIIDQQISPSVTVEVLTAGEVRVSNATTPITLTLGDNAEGGALTGASVNAVSGLATFPNLTPDTEGSFTLIADADGLTGATSNAFTVNPIPASNEPTDVTMVQIVGLEADDLTTDLTLVTNSQYGDTGLTITKQSGTIVNRDLSGAQSWRAAGVAVIPVPPIGSKALQTAFGPSANEGANEKGKLSKTGITGAKTLYLRDYILITSNYKNHGASQTKTHNVFLTGGGNNCVPEIRGTGTSTLWFATEIQGSSPASPLGHHPTGNTAGTTVTRNQWHKVERVVVGETTAGDADGHLTLFIDGVEKYQVTGIRWNSKASVGTNFSEVAFDCYFGGTGNTNLPTEQSLFRTGLYLSKSASRAAVP